MLRSLLAGTALSVALVGCVPQKRDASVDPGETDADTDADADGDTDSDTDTDTDSDTDADPGGGPYLYTADWSSNSVYRVDVANDTIEVAFQNDALGTPRGFALDDEGRVYVAQHGLDRGVIRFRTDGTYVDQFVAGPFGASGAGNLRYAGGELVVAGDTQDNGSIYRYDVDSGALLGSARTSGTTTVLGVHTNGSTVWAVGYFSDTIVRYDGGSPSGTLLASGLQDRSLGITVGHDGHLLVCNDTGPDIREFTGSGGDLGVFASFEGGHRDIVYDVTSGSYFVTAAAGIYQLDTDGNTIGEWTHPEMGRPYGLALTYSEF